jgi:peptide deformylase
MFEQLKIITYPDPRLKRLSVDVSVFDARLKALATRMLELMREEKGVGLAAPQVGENIRMFVANPDGSPEGDRIYVNPSLTDLDTGAEEAEEGCLSLPDIRADILRGKSMRIDALDLLGNPFSETQSGFAARVWQHEFDHLNGTLILDRMGPVAKMACKRVLKELEEKYAAENPVKKRVAR